MEEAFWQSRWRENKIAFHEARPNTLLERYVDRLALEPGATIFLPLCGKTVDIDWLIAKGLLVKGVEFNEGAVQEVFARNNLSPIVNEVAGLKRYSTKQVEIFVGDLFKLTADMLGTVHGIYDRAALVALPKALAAQYVHHIPAITKKAAQLLISYDYDQSQMEGPPFSVPLGAVESFYEGVYSVEQLSEQPITGPLADRCSGLEYAALLTAS
ncbi:MAG: thiopurine S-methyltransferase [Pseudomonadota bacterium]